MQQDNVGDTLQECTQTYSHQLMPLYIAALTQRPCSSSWCVWRHVCQHIRVAQLVVCDAVQLHTLMELKQDREKGKRGRDRGRERDRTKHSRPKHSTA